MKRLNINLDNDFHLRLKTIAASKGMTISQYVIDTLQQSMKNDSNDALQLISFINNKVEQ